MKFTTLESGLGLRSSALMASGRNEKRGCALDPIEGIPAVSANSLLAQTPASVHADGLQFIAPGIRDRSFAAVGQHDRCAVGGVKRKQLQARRDLRRLGKQPRHVLRADLFYIGDVALAQGRQSLR